MRKLGSLLVAAFLALVSTAAIAGLTEGVDYTTLSPPQPTGAKDQIEVAEFFWYGCPHCYAFEPVLNKWLETLPGDVVFRRIPALYPSGHWTPGARLYYALRAIGEEDRVHAALFTAIHIDLMDYTDPATVTKWLVKQGVDRQRFTAAYNSSEVQDKILRAEELTRSYGITSVPTMAVGGRYLTSNTMAGSFEAVPAILDQLIDKVRAGK
ncbi:MAG TPA: thiol:disulfide interchange protein DsbA/DsbL [Rhodocyclaceae bacterium]|nr:thiol:disulfide interchange protein DsbA/DsbL [Rhodocyclaceae bacterium]